MSQIALLLIILALCIKYGKMHFLIAGYNTMSKEEKAKVDIEKVTSVFRNVMFAMAGLLLLADVLDWWLNDIMPDTYILFGTLLTGGISLMAITNSKKYRRDK